eukprot:scaffold57278_cov36-Phaeocystis_antarctica.AAC.1
MRCERWRSRIASMRTGWIAKTSWVRVRVGVRVRVAFSEAEVASARLRQPPPRYSGAAWLPGLAEPPKREPALE